MSRMTPSLLRFRRTGSFLARWLAPALLAFLMAGIGVPRAAQAQTAASVVENMKQSFLNQFEGLDTYVVETDLYTSYNRRVEGANPPEFESRTQLKGQSQAIGGMGSASQSQYGQFYRLADHARHAGIETVDGRRCHILRVDDPGKLNADLQGQANQITYYIDADSYQPRRMQFEMQGQSGQSVPQSVTVTMQDYRTVDDLTLPWKIQIQTNLNETLSAQQRRQLQEMKEQMEQMDEEQRQMMERMMGDQMKQMEQMMSGEPMVVQVQSVTVNEPLPEGVFDSGSNR